MAIFLQIWGGSCYLLNKILLAVGQDKDNSKTLKIWGWAFYLIGLPAWVIILVWERSWIAATIEAGGAPSMVLGLLLAIRGQDGEKMPGALDRFAMIFAYVLLTLGVLYSLLDYGGLTSLTQLLEIGITVGFLGGTYLLAKSKPLGWLLFLLMNASTGLLMLIQGNYILAAQQAISLLFVAYGYQRAARGGRGQLVGAKG